MLTFAEEFLLLSHDEKSGQFHDPPALILDTALAAAVMMDLALLNRIDTDLDTLTLIFERNGFAAKAAYSADEALESSREFRPNLLLCDVTMPDRKSVV